MKFVHQRDSDVASDHGEGAMREIDEIHQPERHRQPDRQDKQQHAIGDAVEQDTEDRGEHGGAAALFFIRSWPATRLCQGFDGLKPKPADA